MENIEKGMSRVSLEADKAASAPASNNNGNRRPTHKSLPKLEISPYNGPLPEEVPADKVQFFMDYMKTYYRPPPSSAFLPYPVLPADRKNKNNNSNNESDGMALACRRRPKPPHYPRYSKWNAVDPYLADPPTPPTLQFTENEALELQQWREVVGELRSSHGEAVQRLLDDPRDTQAKDLARRLSRARAEMVENIADIHERRRVRRNFRRDFNHVVPGW